MIDVSLIKLALPHLLQGALVTLQIAGLSFLLGITGGRFWNCSKSIGDISFSYYQCILSFTHKTHDCSDRIFILRSLNDRLATIGIFADVLAVGSTAAPMLVK